MFKRLSELVANQMGISPHLQIQIVLSLLTIICLIICHRIIIAIIWRKTEDIRTRYLWRKASIYILTLIGFLGLINIWFQGLSNLGTYLGLLSAGVAIALKDPLTNIAGWLFIVMRRPFSVGDRIQIGTYTGDVIDIRVFQFSLMEISEQSTGRIIHVPNNLVFTIPCANFTQGFGYIWNEIPVLVTFESDWRKAKTLLLNIASFHTAHLTGIVEEKFKSASNRFMITYSKLTPTVYTSVQESGILLTIRHLCDPRERRLISEAIYEDILDEFAKHNDIDFAYPTVRYYDHSKEGKSPAETHQ